MYQVSIEATENPKILKFVAKYTLIENAVELDRNSNVSEIPLAQELFNYPFVDRIFITANFVAVSKENTVEWDLVSQDLKNIIEDQLLANPKIFLPKKTQQYNIYAEMTPNPDVMKFVSNKNILSGFLEAKNITEAENIPLAKEILEKFSFIKEVFINDNFLALTKNNEFQWHEVMIEVRNFIAEYLQSGKQISNIPASKRENPVQNLTNREYTEDEKKINDILNEYVSPAIENDGGKISLIEYDNKNKIAKMLLQGACSGCPSSTMTLKNGIESILKQFLPELVSRVEAING